jgi:glutamate-1-semialdehyde 2,1-aminomutase
MEQLAPLGAVYQAGTLSGNPIAVAAGLATLSLLDPAAYERLTGLADALVAGVSGALDSAGVPFAVGRAGTLASFFLGLPEAPVTFDAARLQDSAAYARLFHALRGAGVYLPPSAFEAWFVSTAHTQADIDVVVGGLTNAL